jgi:hypothetical protein
MTDDQTMRILTFFSSLPAWALGLFLLVGVLAVPAEGQAVARTWTELLETRTRVAYRTTHPDPPGTCPATNLPERVLLASPRNSRPVGKTWLPGPNHSRWEPVVGPSTADTLEVRVAALWCGAAGPSVLVEWNGYFLEIDNAQIAQISESGELTAGVLLEPRTDGAPRQLALRRECPEPGCGIAFADAESYADDVRSAVAARREAERARLAEAERRSELEAATRARDGFNVRGQTDAIMQRERAELLRRSGASEEQVQAILAGRVLTGMTPAMVRNALGDPQAVRQEGQGTQASTIWTYPGREVAFVGGRVSRIR